MSTNIFLLTQKTVVDNERSFLLRRRKRRSAHNTHLKLYKQKSGPEGTFSDSAFEPPTSGCLSDIRLYRSRSYKTGAISRLSYRPNADFPLKEGI